MKIWKILRKICDFRKVLMKCFEKIKKIWKIFGNFLKSLFNPAIIKIFKNSPSRRGGARPGRGGQCPPCPPLATALRIYIYIYIYAYHATPPIPNINSTTCHTYTKYSICTCLEVVEDVEFRSWNTRGVVRVEHLVQELHAVAYRVHLRLATHHFLLAFVLGSPANRAKYSSIW